VKKRQITKVRAQGGRKNGNAEELIGVQRARSGVFWGEKTLPMQTGEGVNLIEKNPEKKRLGY